MRPLAARVRSRRRDQRGYAAVLVALLLPVVFIGFSAVAVDTARWYVQVQRTQNAADAASLAGVPYMPQDLPSASTLAEQVAARNGFDDTKPGISVTAEQGGRASQLKVTVSSTVTNPFGSLIGVPSTRITRSAVSDYTGPVPMGSPCNTFSNEPPSQPGAAQPTGTVLPPVATRFANCKSNPQFWADVQGPGTQKVFGDRYSTKTCGSASPAPSPVYGCSGSTNDEYSGSGYFFNVKVLPGAVGTPVDLQLYDPAFVYTGMACEGLPPASSFTDNMNPYVSTDGVARYGRGLGTTTADTPSYCTGDFSLPNDDYTKPVTTSFGLRDQTDTNDPMKATPIAGCTKQYKGVGLTYDSATGTIKSPANAQTLKGTTTTAADPAYWDQLAKVFHSWVSLCTFTPARAGDYYLQVRTNVSAAGAAETDPNGKPSLVYSGNSAVTAPTDGNMTAGYGNNAFGIRAKTLSGKENLVSVSGRERMPIFANASASTSTFNLVRVLPGAAGQFVSFEFFDVGDADNPGTVRVIRPTDATGSIANTTNITGCRAMGPVNSQNLSNCTLNVQNSTHNGKVQSMSIPIPSDYGCTYSSPGGCWFLVEVKFNSGNVNDITTWNASVVGDPVRLIR